MYSGGLGGIINFWRMRGKIKSKKLGKQQTSLMNLFIINPLDVDPSQRTHIILLSDSALKIITIDVWAQFSQKKTTKELVKIVARKNPK